MYFANRKQAGRMLASQIAEKYPNSDSAVVALSDGGVVVGMEIARELQSVISMLLIGQINLPQELTAIAGITQNGAFSYNQAYSPGEIEELAGEYRGLIEQEKFDRIREMNDIGSGELIRKDLLQDRNVILVSDGLTNGFSIDLALQYLKPIGYKKLIIATPLASVVAVDRMHILADDIYCLNVLEEFISVDHYYDVNDTPEHDIVVRTVSQIVKNWK
jgi:putative phosphoribosyl transferase